MAYRIVKWAMAVIAVLYLALVMLVSNLAGLRGSIIAWMFYAAYVLITVVIWSIDHKASKPLGEDIDKDQVNKETKLTQEVQHNLSHWSWLSLF